MNVNRWMVATPVFAALYACTVLFAQPEPRPGFRPGGPPPGFGPLGPELGGPGPRERKVVKDFDKDGDKRLDAAERKAAREFLDKEPRRGPFGGRFGPQQPPPERVAHGRQEA
jgi:hypothetical protein